MVGSRIPRCDDNASVIVLHFCGTHSGPSIESKVTREVIDPSVYESADTSASLHSFSFRTHVGFEHYFYKVLNSSRLVAVLSMTMY
jgi:hypothetical protein